MANKKVYSPASMTSVDNYRSGWSRKKRSADRKKKLQRLRETVADEIFRAKNKATDELGETTDPVLAKRYEKKAKLKPRK